MEQRTRIFLVAGARPNFMKIAPLQRALAAGRESSKGESGHGVETRIVHTGQHYDFAMSRVFFEQLEIPEPDFHLEVGSGSHAWQTAQVMLRFEKLLTEQRPDLVVVVGDVNSTLAAALTAAKLHVPVTHVEAGLRSFDLRMPEEVNRVLTDHVSAPLFATEPAATANLAREGIPDSRVHLVGNVMVDELQHHRGRIESRGTAELLGLRRGAYGLATIHRAANVDDATALSAILAALRAAAARGPVVFPVHPRTAKNIAALGLEGEFTALGNLRRIEPLGYLDFMNLLAGAAFMLTDSGGVQIEAAYLRVPCITLRETTEHVITIEQGCNRLCPLETAAVREALDWATAFDRGARAIPAVWDGHAADRTAAVLSAALGH